jgi:hypothetical protein
LRLLEKEVDVRAYGTITMVKIATITTVAFWVMFIDIANDKEVILLSNPL